MKTVNEQIAELVKSSGCGLYVTASNERDIKWQAVECRTAEGSAFKQELRSGFGITPEAAIADCKTHEFAEFNRRAQLAAAPGDDAIVS